MTQHINETSSSSCDMHLHAEIEELQQLLTLREQHVVALETACMRETDRMTELEGSVGAWQDKYDRLYDSHKRLQKVNASLEDKLLRLVDRSAGERAQLTGDVATLSLRLAQANHTVTTLQRDKERYKNDMAVAIQLLQCKPESFMPQKINSLPSAIQSKLGSYIRLDIVDSSTPGSPVLSQSGRVSADKRDKYNPLPRADSPTPLCPFPPTAMVYSMRGYDTDLEESNREEVTVSASIVGKILEDGIKESFFKHCDTCQCSANNDLAILSQPTTHYSISTQTTLHGENQNSLCLRCNNNISSNSSNRSNSPFAVRIVRNDNQFNNHVAVANSSVSKSDKSNIMILKTRNKQSDKNEDLIKFETVVPPLGHHRLCDKIKVNSELSLASNIISETSSKTSLVGGDVCGSVNKDSSEEIIIDLNDVDIDLRNNSNDIVSSVVSSIGSNNNNKKTTPSSAKLFEHFNRTMIQDLKADNSSTRPRLCSLRIQDGSDNILLDNAESSVSPVLYTRRKSSNIDAELYSNMMEDDNGVKVTKRMLEKHDSVHSEINQNGSKNTNLNSSINYDIIESSIQSNGNIRNGRCSSENSAKPMLSSKIIPNEVHIHRSKKVTKNGTKCQDSNRLRQHDDTSSSSCGNTKESFTQTGSTSSYELRESSLMLRQQLNRVAEWVHTNSKLDYNEPSDSSSDYNKVVNGQIYHNSQNDYKTKGINNRYGINKNGVADETVAKGVECAQNGSNDEMSDFAQKEYNVKQFLLKEGIWHKLHTMPND